MDHELMLNAPPCDPEAEKNVLGTIMIDVESAYDVMEILSPKDFYLSKHQKIMAAIMDMVSVGEATDLVTITSWLMNKQDLDSVGGAAYLAGLTDVIPMRSAVRSHCKIIRNKAVARQMITLSAEIMRRCYSSEPVNEIAEDFGREFFKIESDGNKGPVSVAEAYKKVFKNINARRTSDNRLSGVSTGFYDLDRILSGLQKTDLIILAARPSMGKTTLGMSIAMDYAKKGGRVLVLSLEMSSSQLVERMISEITSIDSEAIRRGKLTDQQMDLIAKAKSTISRMPITIDDAAAQSISRLRAKVNRFASQGGVDLIMVDYLQLISAKADTRDREISQISAGLKAIAKDLDVPLLALAQLNRSLENRTDKKPKLSDLRDSGSIEQDADVVLFIYRDEIYNKSEKNPHKGTADIIIAKHRNGRTGEVRLGFDGRYYKFMNLQC